MSVYSQASRVTTFQNMHKSLNALSSWLLIQSFLLGCHMPDLPRSSLHLPFVACNPSTYIYGLAYLAQLVTNTSINPEFPCWVSSLAIKQISSICLRQTSLEITHASLLWRKYLFPVIHETCLLALWLLAHMLNLPSSSVYTLSSPSSLPLVTVLSYNTAPHWAMQILLIFKPWLPIIMPKLQFMWPDSCSYMPIQIYIPCYTNPLCKLTTLWSSSQGGLLGKGRNVVVESQFQVLEH